MKKRRLPSPLLRELLQAARLARAPAFAEILLTAGWTSLGCPMWGIDAVSAGDTFYQPDENGQVAAILPAFEGPHLVDLVACSFATREMRTRRGIAQVLGHDWIEDACLGLQPLAVYADALSWLRNKCRGVVVIDWTAAPRLLRDVPALHCESEAVAAALTQAFERPSPYPPILVRNGETR
jgi:hypothetical protein